MVRPLGYGRGRVVDDFQATVQAFRVSHPPTRISLSGGRLDAPDRAGRIDLSHPYLESYGPTPDIGLGDDDLVLVDAHQRDCPLLCSVARREH